jgi:hypothetical protein
MCTLQVEKNTRQQHYTHLSMCCTGSYWLLCGVPTVLYWLPFESPCRLKRTQGSSTTPT